MGNKNARGNAALLLRPSNKPFALPQMIAPIPSSSNSSQVVAVENAKAESMSSDSKPKIQNKPTTLAFRSYQTGTLHSNHFEPSGSVPAQNPVANTKKRLSATSAAFVPVNSSVDSSPSESLTISKLKALLSPSDTVNSGLSSIEQLPSSDTTLTIPSGPGSDTGLASTAYGDFQPSERNSQFIRALNTREDKSLKDVVIQYGRVRHNIVCLHEMRDTSGNISFVDSGDYTYGNYNFEIEITKMTPKERYAFWISNWVEIIVDIDSFDGAHGNWGYTKQELDKLCDDRTMEIVNVMNGLGPDFATFTRTVFITIKFPEETPIHVPEYLFQNLHEQMQSRAYRAMQNICDKLKEFTSLQRLEIILHTQAHSRNPVALPQLHYALPFYELPFTKWQLKWQNSYMSRAELIRGWPITHLDIERAKIDRNLARDQQSRGQERTQERVYVRISASPAVHDLPFAPRSRESRRHPHCV